MVCQVTDQEYAGCAVVCQLLDQGGAVVRQVSDQESAVACQVLDQGSALCARCPVKKVLWDVRCLR